MPICAVEQILPGLSPPPPPTHVAQSIIPPTRVHITLVIHPVNEHYIKYSISTPRALRHEALTSSILLEMWKRTPNFRKNHSGGRAPPPSEIIDKPYGAGTPCRLLSSTYSRLTRLLWTHRHISRFLSFLVRTISEDYLDQGPRLKCLFRQMNLCLCSCSSTCAGRLLTHTIPWLRSLLKTKSGMVLTTHGAIDGSRPVNRATRQSSTELKLSTKNEYVQSH